jgi:hypothetical protein
LRRAPFALALAALLAVGWIPSPSRIANAVAKENREAGRARTLELAVELRFEGDTEPAARGTLLSDPDGAARLELVSPRGFAERHLSAGGRTLASRDGQPLDDARHFLPPLWLLQAGSSGDLSRWVAELGGDMREVELGYQGDWDCYVLGGRHRAGGRGGAYWVDQESLAPVRIDLADGTHFRFGPGVAFEGIVVPGWIDVDAPGEPPARLRILGARARKTPSGGLEPAWLRQGPARPPRPGAGVPEPGAAASPRP